MKKIIITFVLLLNVIVSISFSQETRGLNGDVVTPYVFKMTDLQSFGDVYLGTTPKRTFNEVEPPYAPEFPTPDARNISNFTYDKSANNPVPFAPFTGTNFEGIAQNGYIPSEPQPAAGPDHILILGNVSVKIADKNGNSLSNVLQTAFFNIPIAEGAGFDAKCFYDYRRRRFVALCETQTSSPAVCKYYLAISATSNAMGTWYVYSFDMTKDGTTQTANWSDFPGLGISDDKLVMSGQQFTFSGNSYQYQKLRIIDRALAYSGAALTFTDIVNWSGQVFVTKPGRNMSAGNDIYILATTYSGGTTVEFRTLTGAPASPVLSAATNINVNAYGIPPDAPGGSRSATVNTGDSRTSDFFVRNGVLNIAFHIGTTISGTNVSAIKFLRIAVNPLNTTPLTDETYGAASTYYYYPMVCVDSAGTMFMGFGKSTRTEYPSSYITGKRRGDATIQSSVLAKSGIAVTSQTRWGDYTGIDMDESATNPGGSYAWYSGQYTKTAATFGTWVTQLNFTYGQIRGQVVNDADGDVTTTGDRTAVTGATVLLKQGTATIDTKITDASGNYNFGYLETATNYSVVFAPPSGKHSVDVMTGTGGTTQTKTDYKTIAVNLTNSQTSTGNTYIVSDWLNSVATGNWNSTSAWKDNVTPVNTDKILINSGHTITVNSNYTCNSIKDNGVLQFDNVSSWLLTISSNLILNNQIIVLGNNNINVGGTISGAGPGAYISTGGTGKLKCTVNNNNTFVLFPIGRTAYNPISIKLSPASTSDAFSVLVKNAVSYPGPNPASTVAREWDISEGTSGGSYATIEFNFNTGEGLTNFTSGQIGHWNGTSWDAIAANISGAGPYKITSIQEITSFSPFIVGNEAPLPVTISSLTSIISGRNINLKWITASEINNAGFEIERVKSSELRVKNWEKIGYVQGKGTVNIPTDYSFEDKNLQTGKYQYRLKQIDNNGNFEYFALNGEVEIGVPMKFELSQNYPNPFNPNTVISFQLPVDSKVSLVIYDIRGKEVKTLFSEVRTAGYYTVPFNGSEFASGVYLYRITTDNFIKTKKMVLVK